VRANQPKFISVHIRRTDHWGSGIANTEIPHADEIFASFMDAHPEYRIHLATDNAETQSFFKRRFGPRLASLVPIAKSGAMRQTSLREAVVDLFTCVAADGPFKGSWQSSFSDTIARLRALHGRAQPDDEHELADWSREAFAALRLPPISPPWNRTQ